MTRIALPSRSRSQPRAGLATLWQGASYTSEGAWSRWKHRALLLIARLRAAPLSFLASIVSLSAVLTLTALVVAGGWIGHDALSQGSEQLSLRVVPKKEDEPTLAALRSALERLPEVKSVRLIDKDGARAELARSLRGATGLLDALDEDNPLPVTFELLLHRLGEEPAATVARVASDLGRQPEVAEVIYHESVLNWVSSLLRGIRLAGSAGIFLVLAIGALVVGMTIRLGVYAHRNEIEVMQLVGADARFVRLPFLVEAAAVGFISGLGSAATVVAALWWLNHGLAESRLGWLYADQAIRFAPTLAAAVLVLGPLLAMSGALLALRMQGSR